MGETADTNSTYIAQRLPSLGLELKYVTILGDSRDDMISAFHRALDRSDIVLVSGGLGPTQDDITRDIISVVLNEEIFVDPDLVETLNHMFKQRGMGIPAPSLNLKQAGRIPSATALVNPVGTAPGWWVEKNRKIIVTMPGVPIELERMWDQEVTPRLNQIADGMVILTRTLKTFGITEAAVGQKVEGHFGLENPYLGIYARPDGIHLRIIAKGTTRAEAQALIEPMEQSIRANLFEAIWGTDDDSLEEQVGNLLQSRNQSLGTMESCTGGLLASSLTDVAGSSGYFKGSIVAYQTQIKTMFGVDSNLIEQYGPVSNEVAQAMAETARARFNCDIGIGITGVAGSEELDGIAPGNVFIGIASSEGSKSTNMRFPPNRPIVKRRAVTHALLQIYRQIVENNVS